MIQHNKILKNINKSVEGKGVINSIINKLPIELHLPRYNFCGPGTKLEKRLKRGDRGINKLDEACREHDITYSQSEDINQRHIADKLLAEKAWQRVKAKDSNFGEKTNAYLVTNLMKAKVNFGMGLSNRVFKNTKKSTKYLNKQNILKRIITDAKLAVKAVKPKNTKSAIKVAIKAARNSLGNTKRAVLPRIIPVPKIGGILPLVPIFAGLSAIGALSGGAAAVAKAVNDANNGRKQLQESQRHNSFMEAIALKNGSGLHLRPFKKGYGLYLNSKNH